MIIITIAIVLIIILLLSIYVYYESNGYHIVSYNINSNKISGELKIVFISDLHNKQYGHHNEQIEKAIDEINPDFVCLGGDMITSCLEKWTDYSDTMEFVKNIAKKYTVFYGMGNHEERLNRVPEKFPKDAYEKLISTLSEINAPIMDDDKVSYNDNIVIYGLKLDHEYYRKFVTKHFSESYLKEKLGDIDKDKFNILIAHNPEHFEGYAKWGADLVLSGHVHGGIVRLPLLGGVISPALKLFPKYDGGIFIENESVMVLSRGLGTHTVPVRVNNKAELIEIVITNG